jgi:probable phosphoglycerate mutase
MQGWAPTPLTERGREQARRAGAAIAEAYAVDRVVASDLRRTRETTAELLDSLDIEPSFDGRWRERSFGDLQGLTVEEVFEGHPEYSLLTSGVAAMEATPPGGESLVDARERVVDGWEALLDEVAPDETVLVVSHGGPLFILLAHVRGQDFETAMQEGWPENAALAELRVHRDGDRTVEVVRDAEPLHDPLPQHDDRHPAGRDGGTDEAAGTDEGGDASEAAGTDEDGDGAVGTTAAVEERVAAHEGEGATSADDGRAGETEGE